VAGSLVLGAVDLMGGGSFRIEALGSDSGTSWGNAAPITEQIQSFIQYGAIVANAGWENREVVVVVRIKGTGAAMAAAEAALFAEIGKPNTLAYTSPATGAVAQVFDVVYSSLEETPDDLAEVLMGKRVYTIRLTCSTFAYSATTTTVAALAASGSTTTNVDNGSSTTGWTATVNGGAVTPSVVSGAVQAASASALSGIVTVAMTRAGSITTSSTKYLVVDWKLGPGQTLNGSAGPTSLSGFSATGDGVTLPVLATGPSPTAGYTRTVFSVAAASVTTLSITAVTTAPVDPAGSAGGAVTRSLLVDNIDRTDIRPSLGSVKQQLRTLAISGSAPTIGSLAVEHSTTSLGDVIVYTCPNDGGAYAPPCRNYRVSGPTTTSDTGAASGFYDAMDATTPTIYDVSKAGLLAGEHLVMVRLNTATGGAVSGSITWSYTPRLNATNLAAATSATSAVSLSAYTFVRLGIVHLPSIDMPSGGSAAMRFSLIASGAALFRLDELYLFNLTTGRLSQIACGSGTAASGGPANRLWIDSPSLDNDGLGRYLMGFAADRSDAYSAYPAASAAGVHEFPPGSLKVFTVTTNPTSAADVSFRYRAGWHTYPAA
jgi:hypothetical protein